MKILRPVMISHNLTVLSALAEAIRLPSGDHATAYTALECPRQVKVFRAVVASQICTVLSALAEAICLPSGDHATAYTSPEWPRQMEVVIPIDDEPFPA